MNEDTRKSILEKGSEIIHLKGYHHTGIQEVLRAAGVPKGSFYFYFKNKEDFGLQVIDYYNAHYSGIARNILGDISLQPLERLYRFYGAFIEFFESRDFCFGCPIGNLSQEMGDLSPAFQKKLKEALDLMASFHISLLEEALEKREISKDIDIPELAYFIVASWHGALVQMKIVKNADPLESHRRMLFGNILCNTLKAGS